MQVSTSSVRREWTNYMDKAEYHYLEDNAAVESGRREMEETLLNWFVLILFFFFSFSFSFFQDIELTSSHMVLVLHFLCFRFFLFTQFCYFQCAKGKVGGTTME